MFFFATLVIMLVGLTSALGFLLRMERLDNCRIVLLMITVATYVMMTSEVEALCVAVYCLSFASVWYILILSCPRLLWGPRTAAIKHPLTIHHFMPYRRTAVNALKIFADLLWGKKKHCCKKSFFDTNHEPPLWSIEWKYHDNNEGSDFFVIQERQN